MKKRYKITFKMGSPIVFLQRPLFDGLLNYCFKRYSTDNSEEQKEFPICVNENGVYLASQLEFPNQPIVFPESFVELYIGEQIRDSKQRINCPKYQSEFIEFNFETEQIDFVKQLVKKYLHFIGKKRFEGNGEIISFQVTETTDKIRRPVPLEHRKDNRTYEVQFRAWKPDYKHPDNKTECFFEEL